MRTMSEQARVFHHRWIHWCKRVPRQVFFFFFFLEEAYYVLFLWGPLYGLEISFSIIFFPSASLVILLSWLVLIPEQRYCPA
jgi:hypothetical protein